jgi:ferredoxin
MNSVMKIKVDMKLCELHGQCAYIAPEVFKLTDDTLEYEADIPADLREKVEKAVRACPQLAIKIVG